MDNIHVKTATKIYASENLEIIPYMINVGKIINKLITSYNFNIYDEIIIAIKQNNKFSYYQNIDKLSYIDLKEILKDNTDLIFLKLKEEFLNTFKPNKNIDDFYMERISNLEELRKMVMLRKLRS